MVGFRTTIPQPNAPLYLGNPAGISAYAEQQTNASNGFLQQLGLAAAGIGAPVIEPEFPTGASAPALEVSTPPTLTEPVWTSPGIPTAFSETLEVGDLDVAPFDATPPAINYAAPPAALDATAPAVPATNLGYTDPTLDLVLPDAPDFLALNIRPFDGVNLPTLSADEPVIDAIAPSLREYVPGATYTSSLLTALTSSLQDRIQNGGTGLGDAEQALWDRNREREARSFRDQELELERRVEVLGYTLPPGVHHESLLRLQRERDAQDRGHSREVMIESARLQLENVKHALSEANSVEGKLIDYTNQTEQRLFESVRYMTQAGIDIYNAKVQVFAQYIALYQTKVQVYIAEIDAQKMLVQVYEAEIRAELAKAEINKAVVERYRVQVDAALASVRVYEAELAGIQAKAEIEKTKILVYGEQVRAYGVEVNAFTAQVEAYRATLEGERVKADVYKSQVDAFTGQVNAAARQVEARVSAYRGRIEAKTVEWDGFKAVVQAEGERVRSLVAVSGAQAEIYTATVRGQTSFNEVLTKQWQATLEQSQRVAEIGISAAKANAELYVTTRSLAMDAAKVGAQVSSQLGAAAINAINWSSSLSNSVSTGYSISDSSSSSESNSNSFSESQNHNYSYSA